MSSRMPVPKICVIFTPQIKLYSFKWLLEHLGRGEGGQHLVVSLKHEGPWTCFCYDILQSESSFSQVSTPNYESPPSTTIKIKIVN